uniref:Uncharacterized protein n=1 Tax=Ceratitis capitata TaxID=7213 RepID=W8C569_CERCA
MQSCSDDKCSTTANNKWTAIYKSSKANSNRVKWQTALNNSEQHKTTTTQQQQQQLNYSSMPAFKLKPESKSVLMSLEVTVAIIVVLLLLCVCLLYYYYFFLLFYYYFILVCLLLQQ